VARHPASIHMSTNEISLPDVGIEERAKEIRTNIRRIGRYNWSLWFLAVVIALSLTFAVATLSMAIVFDPHDPFYHFRMNQSVRGLVGMVLLFSVYTLFQQFQLMRTRRRLAEQVEISTEQHMLAESYLKLAMLDPLTGLHNRRYAQDRLVAEIARAQRQKSSLTVLMIDVDELKRINDHWGHAAGDLVLKTFGAGPIWRCESAATSLWFCCRSAIKDRFSAFWTAYLHWKFSSKRRKSRLASPQAAPTISRASRPNSCSNARITPSMSRNRNGKIRPFRSRNQRLTNHEQVFGRNRTMARASAAEVGLPSADGM